MEKKIFSEIFSQVAESALEFLEPEEYAELLETEYKEYQESSNYWAELAEDVEAESALMMEAELW